MDSKLLNLTGLWFQKSKNGTTYMSGSIGRGINLLVFKNTKKRPNSNDPDYHVCLAPNEPKEKPPASSDSNEEEPF